MKLLVISPDYLNDSTGGLEKQISLLSKYIHFDILYQKDRYYLNKDKRLDKLLINKKINNYDKILVMCNDNRIKDLLGNKDKIIINITTHPDLFLQRVGEELFEKVNQYRVRVQLKEYQRYFSNSFVIPNIIEAFNGQSFIDREKIELVTCINKNTENKRINLLYELGEIRKDIKIHIFSNSEFISRENIIIHKYENKIYEAFRNKTAYISTSRYEGMSNSVLQAINYGLPIIADEQCHGSNWSITSNGIKYKDIKELAHKIDKVKYIVQDYDISKHYPEKILEMWKYNFKNREV